MNFNQLEALPVLKQSEIERTAMIGDFFFRKVSVTINCPNHGEVSFNEMSVSAKPIERVVCQLCQKEQDDLKNQYEFNQAWKIGHTAVNLPNHLSKMRFSDYDAYTDERQGKIVYFLKDYAVKFANGERSTLPNVLLLGNTGTGKTMLAACLINEIFAIGYKARKVRKALFSRSSEITRGANEAKFDYSDSEQEFLDVYIKNPLLAIDDLGENDTGISERQAKIDRERFSEILDGRYKKLPTVITSNMNDEQVKQFLGDRAWDRICEKLVIIRCDWESYRQQNRKVMEL